MAQDRHKAHLYDSRLEALYGRVSLIQNPNAQKIYMSTYIFADDEVGWLHAKHLMEQARKGKDVKLLIDGTGLIKGLGSPKISSELLYLMIDAGVDVRTYRGPKLKHLLKFNRRMHDKLIINDVDELITGGANTQNSYFDMDKPSRNQKEYEAYIRGKASKDASLYFEELIESSAVDKLRKEDLKVSVEKLYHKSQQLDGILDYFHSRGLVPKDKLFPNFQKAIEVEHVKFISHGLKAHKKSPLSQALFNLIQGTKKTLTIDAQYLIPTKELYEQMRKAISQNPELKISIVTNGHSAMTFLTDLNPEEHKKLFSKRDFMTLAYDSELVTLSNLGEPLSVWEFNGHGKIHSKTIVADKTKALLWTANIDPRSQNWNLEVGVEIHSPHIANKLEQKIQTYLRTSSQVIKSGQLKKKLCPRFFDRLFVKLVKWLL